MRTNQNSNRTRNLRRCQLALALVAAMAAPIVMAQDTPQNGRVEPGNGSVEIGAEINKQMTIKQTSRGAIITWDSFNIGANYNVAFENATFGASSVTLNRVLGYGQGYGAPTTSRIDGTLTAVGNVFIINPAGIIFGGDSNVTVGSLVASTMDIADDDFLSGVGTGNYQFQPALTPLPGAVTDVNKVTNSGNITADRGGTVAFIGSALRNNGDITTPGGTVVFGSGNQVTLDFVGDGLTQITVNGPGVSYQPPVGGSGQTDPRVNGIAENSGTIIADGGQILMHVESVPGNTGPVIENTGTLQAHTMVNRAGRIELTAPGGLIRLGDPNGKIPFGVIDVSGGAYVGGVATLDGGSVVIHGVAGDPDNSSLIDSSGSTGGGQVNILSTTSIVANEGTSIKSNAVDSGNGGSIRLAADSNIFALGDMAATGGATSGNGGFIDLSSTAGLVGITNLNADGSKVGDGGQVKVSAAAQLVAVGAVSVKGGARGGSAELSGNQVTLGATSSVNADGGDGIGGSIVVDADSTLRIFGTLSARGGNAGGSIGTSTGGLFNVVGADVDAGSTGIAGTWTFEAPRLNVVNGAAGGSDPTGVLGTNLRNGEINNAFANGTNVVLGATNGDVQINATQILSASSSPLFLHVNATGAIYGTGFTIGSTGGALEMLFNANSAGGNDSGGYIDFRNATLSSSGGLIAMYGESDQAAGYARGDANGIRLGNSDIDSAGGGVTLRGYSSGGSSYGDDDAGVLLETTNIYSSGGNVGMRGTGAGNGSGVIARNGRISTRDGQLSVEGTAYGTNARGVSLDAMTVRGGAGDVRVSGTANQGSGVLFANATAISTTSGAVTLVGIGESVGMSLDAGEVATETGYIDLRGRGLGAGSDGLLLRGGINILTDAGGVGLSGEGGSGAGISLSSGSTVDAGDSLVVLRARNDSSSDSIRFQGAIRSGVGVNLRLGGVDFEGGLHDHADEKILVGSDTNGFSLSGSDLAMIDSPEVIIGSSLHAGAIQVLAAISRDGNLTLQNDGGPGGIDIQAALGVGTGTLALSSGGSITQTNSGPITAHSLLATATGDVLLGNAQNNVAATTLAGSAGGDFQFQDVDTLAIGNVGAVGFDASSGALSSFGANGIGAGGNVIVRNLAGDMVLNAGVVGANIDLVTAGRLQNTAGATLSASGNWRVWASTWEGETRGGLAGSGDIPNLYGCTYGAGCAASVPAADDHFLYLQQPTALINFADFTREYGLANPGFTYTVTGAVLGDAVANVASGTATSIGTIASDVGLYPIAGIFTSAAGYRIQLIPGTLSVTPATLFFTADRAVRYLGTDNPKLTGTVTGFRNGDSAESLFGTTGIWSSPADFFSQVGFYPVNGGKSTKNYVLSQSPGNATALQVIPLPQLSSTPIDLVRETVNTYVYDRNFGGAPVCALNSSLADEKIASTGDELSTEWSKVRSRPNLTNCFDTEREDGCSSF